MTTTMALSRPAAIAHLMRSGMARDEAQAVVDAAPVAARWNDGLGRVAYYYPKDLERK